MDEAAKTRPRRARRWLASAGLLAVGVIALFAMGPQFMVFIPVLIGAWLLARFGLVPRRFHDDSGGLRISGGPEAGDLRCAEVLLEAPGGDRQRVLALGAGLIEALTRAAGAGPAVAGDAARLDAPLASLLEGRARALTWGPGAAAEARFDASDAAARWRQAWPEAAEAQAQARAGCAMAGRWTPGAESAAHLALIGEPRMLGAALAEFARASRERHDVPAWTSGWPREMEREFAARSARRDKRSSAGSRAG